MWLSNGIHLLGLKFDKIKMGISYGTAISKHSRFLSEKNSASIFCGEYNSTICRPFALEKKLRLSDNLTKIDLFFCSLFCAFWAPGIAHSKSLQKCIYHQKTWLKYGLLNRRKTGAGWLWLQPRTFSVRRNVLSIASQPKSHSTGSRVPNSSWNCLPQGMGKMRNHYFYSSGNGE